MTPVLITIFTLIGKMMMNTFWLQNASNRKTCNPEENELYSKQDKIVTILRAKQSCINTLLIPPEKRRGHNLPELSTKLQSILILFYIMLSY